MKANEVLNLLRITRPTLTKYVKEGIIKVDKLPNGRYEYDSNSVYSFLNKDVKRKTYIYARVLWIKTLKILKYLLTLFVTNQGVQINADLNGAYQILKKAFPIKWDRGCVLHPIVVNMT